MKKLFKKIASLGFGLALAVGVGAVLGQKQTSEVKAAEDAPVDTVLWGEKFDHFGTKKPSEAGTGTGTTIYGEASITYTQSSDSTKGYNENLAGGTAPELLLAKNNQSWTINGINSGNADEMSLVFLSNRTTFSISCTESTKYSVKGEAKSWTITLNEGQIAPATFGLVFKNTGSSNARIDDIELKVTKAHKTLTSLAVTTNPTRMTYYVGEAFDPTGMIVTATYADGSTDDVTSECTFSPERFNAVGQQTVTISHQKSGKSTTLDVTVNAARVLENVYLDGDMLKKEYYTTDESWDFTGLTLTGHWSVGDDSNLGNVQDLYDAGKLDMTLSSDKPTAGSLIISDLIYEDEEGDLFESVAGYSKVITGITVVEKPGTEENPYTVAQARDAIDKGTDIQEVYGKGIVSEIVTAWDTKYNNVSFNMSDDGTKTSPQLEAYRAASGKQSLSKDDNILVGDFVVVYGNLKKYNSTYEFDAACTIEVRKHVSSIAVKTAPTKITYDAGETFNPEGLVVTATYDDTTTKDFAYNDAASLFTFNKTTLVKTDTSVEITLFGKNTSQAVTVNAVPAVLNVTVVPSELTLDISETYTLVANVEVDEGASQEVTWSSSDANIATVDQTGKVTAIARGKVNIIATSVFDNTKSGACELTVNDPNFVIDTWDLTTDSYDSADEKAVVWSSEAVTITSAKGSSGTPANNYIPTAKNSTRVLYSGQTFTISPNDSYTITSVILTKSGGTVPSSWTNATSTTSGNDIILTPKDGNADISTTSTGYLALVAIEVDCVRDTTTKSLSIKDSELETVVNGSATTTLTEVNFSGGVYTVDTDPCATVSITGTTVNVTGVAEGSHTFTITENTYSLTVQLTVTVIDPTNVFTKITSVTNLVDGAHVYIGVANDGSKIAGCKNASKNYLDPITTSGATGTVIPNEPSYVKYLVGADSNGYYFKNESDNTYLYYTGADNEIYCGNDYDAANLEMHWNVTISDAGVATITNAASTDRFIRYNNSASRFACYTSAQTAIAFFVKNIDGITDADRVNTFSNLYMHKIDIPTTDESDTGKCLGVDGYYAKAKAAITGDWASIATEFHKTEMWDRYVAWGRANGEIVTFNNDTITSETFLDNSMLTSSSSSTTTLLIIIISVTSASLLCLVLISRKRKAIK